tara:strand:- start:1737 stop:1943 length:207 start_codon:yes stop_codon:yes gene_type:complete
MTPGQVTVAPVTTANPRIAAASIFADVTATLSLHSQHGTSDSVKSVAARMKAAIEKRRDELIAEATAL